MTSKPAFLTVHRDGEYTPLPTPSEYTCIPQDLVKATRNARGDLRIYPIAVKRQISVVWYAVTAEQMRTIASQTAGTCSVLYYDQETNATVEGTFYRGSDYDVRGVDRFVRGSGGTLEGHAHYRVSMTLTEC